MNAVVQRFLISQIDVARLGPPHHVIPKQHWRDWRQLTVARFDAQLVGFNAINLLSSPEIDEWRARMARVFDLAEWRVETVRVSNNRFPEEDEAEQSTVPRFLRLIPGVSPVPTNFGGLFQVLSIEFYDRLVAVNWRLAPLPDTNAAYAAELEQHSDDSRQLPEENRKALRAHFVNMLRISRGFDIGLADDSGRRFMHIGGSSSGTSVERVGRTKFEPSLGEGVNELVVEFGAELRIHVPI